MSGLNSFRSLAAGLLIVLGSEAASAAPVPVVNHGFEANAVPPNNFRVLLPTGWVLFDPAGIIDQSNDAVGAINPTGSTFFPAGAPEGMNAALVFLATDVGVAPAGLRQVLGAVLEPNTRYTLRVDVGNIASGFGDPNNFFYDLDGFPGYQVALVAGGDVIAMDNNSLSGMIPEGEFRMSSVEVDIGAAHLQMGQPLEIRVVNLNMPGTATEPGIEVDFDNVRLDAEAIVPPCDGDADGDGIVNFADITDVLANFGAMYPGSTGPGDADHDGDVEFADITNVLANFAIACP